MFAKQRTRSSEDLDVLSTPSKKMASGEKQTEEGNKEEIKEEVGGSPSATPASVASPLSQASPGSASTPPSGKRYTWLQKKGISLQSIQRSIEQAKQKQDDIKAKREENNLAIAVSKRRKVISTEGQ